MNSLKTYLNKPLLRHVLFWSGVFLYFFLVANSINYASTRHILESYALIVGLQMITAYSCLYFLMPRFLNRGKPFLFILLMVLLLVVLFIIYNVCKVYYFDPTYYDSYNELSKAYAKLPITKRLMNFQVLLSKGILYASPTAFLLLLRFYRNQRKYLKLNEQKKVAELSALKNQLNPHFLFNTLNNLYALAIAKSDKTPEVIERLSDMLDYMLYRCNDTYVSLKKEIGLIENYLALEKVRYGKRVAVTFDHQISKEVQIAPLLLLTFVENAFKHGVRQELEQAKITISIRLVTDMIVFNIDNTIPVGGELYEPKIKEPLGIKNVQQQLTLLYPNAHELSIDASKKGYSVCLKLQQK